VKQTTNAAGKLIGASCFMFHSRSPFIKDPENGCGVNIKVGCTANRCRLPHAFDYFDTEMFTNKARILNLVAVGKESNHRYNIIRSDGSEKIIVLLPYQETSGAP
jgi:hypothetical protein